MAFGIDPQHLRQFYIGGRWVAPLGGGRPHRVVNPANEQPSGELLFGDERDAVAAIEAAHAAFDGWSRTTLDERLALLERVCAIYERRMGDMAEAITAEMGAPMEVLSRPLQAPIGLWHLQTAMAMAREHGFERKLSHTRVVKEPVGVCTMITPWNWPINQVTCKVAPALVTGCTVVLKPSQNAPYSSLVLAEILHEAGLPAGAFNLIQGEGGRLGEVLASHPLVDMVSLTGSTSAGVQVTKAAADTVKRVSLELGGKSANVILEGADLKAAVTHGVLHMMSNTGQTCTAPSRMLVPASRIDEVEAIAAEACQQIVVGDPHDPKTTVGPLSNRRQFDKVQEMIAVGEQEGARLIAGGRGRPGGLELGYYAKPTVFSRCNNKMRIAQEEIFGPVLTIIPYQNEEEAIAIANDSVYGLSGYVYGRDTQDAERVARRLRTGMVHLNGTAAELGAPFGGYKQSGNGREWGYAGLDEFLEMKSIFGAVAPPAA